MRQRKANESISINIRAKTRQRDLIDQAAEREGRSRSEFMLDAACRRAEDILLDQAFFTVDADTFEKFQTLAKTDKEIDRVLSTYSQKHLISANSILISCLQNLDIKENKKIYFVKNGQVAWLLSYIADSAKGSKVIY